MFSDTHDVFVAPSNHNQVIWRHMEFAKYISLLTTNTLFFSRLDLLGDNFEGSITTPNFRRDHDFAKQLISSRKQVAELVEDGIADPRTLDESYEDQLEKALKWIRQMRWIFRMTTHVCCWHMNDTESAAMWKLYSESPYSVAIRSSYSRLCRAVCLDQNHTVYIGTVRYTDYETEMIDETNLVHPIMHKRHSFKHEHELRAAVSRSGLAFKDDRFCEELVNATRGTSVAVDLSELIEEVVISPSSPDWFEMAVKETSSRFGLAASIRRSLLDADPNW